MCAQFDQALLPRNLLKRDPEVRAETYKTIYGTSFVNRYALDTSRLNNFCGSGGMGVAMKLYVDRVSCHPPRPMTVFNSTMKDHYPAHPVCCSTGIVVPSIKNMTECKLNSVGLDCELPFPREEGGNVRNELDCMLATTAKDFRRFRPDELQADAPVTIYTEKGYRPNVGIAPTTGSCGSIRGMRRKKGASDTFVPRKPQLVPHNGMCSETGAKFQHRTDELFYAGVFPFVRYPTCVYPYRKEEAFISPGMYFPESAHYGSGIPVCRFVDPGKVGSTSGRIDFCTMKKKTVAH